MYLITFAITLLNPLNVMDARAVKFDGEKYIDRYNYILLARVKGT